jgi:hypothetical protein
MQVRQLLQEVEHMQERHMQLQQQQQQPTGAAGSSGIGSSSQAIEPAAVLLCGDLNTIPDSDTVRVSIAGASLRHCAVQCEVRTLRQEDCSSNRRCMGSMPCSMRRCAQTSGLDLQQIAVGVVWHPACNQQGCLRCSFADSLGT